jgi:hypothetical protein
MRIIYRPVFQVLLSLAESQKRVKQTFLVSICPLIKSGLRELVHHAHIHIRINIKRCRMWLFGGWKLIVDSKAELLDDGR